MRTSRTAASVRSAGVLAGLLTCLLTAAVLVALPVGSAQAAAPRLTASAPAVKEGEQTTVTFRLRGGEGRPLPDRRITIQRKRDGAWTTIGQPSTDDEGRARIRVRLGKYPDGNRVRGTYRTGNGAIRTIKLLALERRRSTLTISGPGQVKSGSRATISGRWRAGDGDPVRATLRLQRRAGGAWKTIAKAKTNRDGVARFGVRPARDVVYRVRGFRQPWVWGAASSGHRVDVVAAGNPVRLPANAPRPRLHPPAQPAAVGAGAHPVVTRIPDQIWNRMTGISWHRGCPVGRPGLRLLKINYWDYQGNRRRGTLVAATGAIDNMARALKAMYRGKLPIRSMYLVDRWGYSKKLRGANDYGSMAAGNTSAFNCRDVVGKPGVRSPHSYGGSLDVNPWENPYRSRDGYVPNRWWPSHSHPRVAWRSRSHPVVKAMRNNGMRWTYGLSDIHHFDAAGYGRMMLVPGCVDTVCH